MSDERDEREDDADAAATEAPGPPSAPSRPPMSLRDALLLAAGVTVADMIAVGFAFQPTRSGIAMIASMGGLYVVLATVAVQRLRKRGEAWRYLRPVRGDLTIGAIVAGVMYVGGMAVHMLLTAHGTPREAWIVRLYILFGDPNEDAYHALAAAVFVVAVLEELTWRGLVQRTLEEALGPGRAVLLASVLFALAHLPTVFLLRDPVAGPNPLIIGAALGCGLVWGYLAARTRRLAPALFAHGLFSWGVVEFPLWTP